MKNYSHYSIFVESGLDILIYLRHDFLEYLDDSKPNILKSIIMKILSCTCLLFNFSSHGGYNKCSTIYFKFPVCLPLVTLVTLEFLDCNQYF